MLNLDYSLKEIDKNVSFYGVYVIDYLGIGDSRYLALAAVETEFIKHNPKIVSFSLPFTMEDKFRNHK